LRRFQAWLLAEEGKTISPNTAAYCKALAKLPLRQPMQACRRVVKKMEKACPWSWYGRRVMVVDGTGLSMPDTPENQAAWPQPKRVKPGCRLRHEETWAPQERRGDQEVREEQQDSKV